MTPNRLISLFAALLISVISIANIVYEPLVVDSGFNRDIIMEKGGTAVSYLQDGIDYWYFATDSVIKANCISHNNHLNDTAKFNRVVRSGWPADYREAIRCTKDGDVYNNDLYKDVYWQLAPYNEPNALCIRPDKSEIGGVGTIKFKKVGSYERIYFLLATARDGAKPKKREVIAKLYYTDGETVQDTFEFGGLSGAEGHNVRLINILESGGTYEKNKDANDLNAKATVFHLDLAKDKLIHRIEFENEQNCTSVMILGVTGVTADIAAPEDEKIETSAIEENSFQACWKAVEDAASYRLDVASDSAFQHILAAYNNKVIDDGTCAEVINLVRDSAYYWRVRSVNSEGGQSASSAPMRVRTAGGTPPETYETHDNIVTELESFVGSAVSEIDIHRTLYRDGYLNTLCLPFNLSAEEIAASPLAGAQIFTFVDAEKIGDSQLNIEMKDTTGIKAGVPYLIKWAPTTPEVIDNGVLAFRNVTIRTNEGLTIGAADKVRFVGNIARAQMELDDHDNLFVGEEDKLYWPNTTNKLKGFRAYFKVPKTGDNAVNANTPARFIFRHDTPTGVEEVRNETGTVRSEKVIRDGQMLIERDGKWYTILGIEVR